MYKKRCEARAPRGGAFLSGILCASLANLTGCATTQEVTALRAEVEKANTVAARAAADVTRTQRELEVLKASAEPPSAFYNGGAPPAAVSPRSSGYKWSCLCDPPGEGS